MTKYLVKRQHLGDKMYMPGDERETSPSDVKHLVDRGILVEKSEAEAADKAEPAVSNKAAPASKNK